MNVRRLFGANTIVTRKRVQNLIDICTSNEQLQISPNNAGCNDNEPIKLFDKNVFETDFCKEYEKTFLKVAVGFLS